MERGRVWTLMEAHSELWPPRCSHKIPASSTDLLDSFLVSRRSCQISPLIINPKLCGILDSASPPNAAVTLPQAVIQKMESLPLQ